MGGHAFAGEVHDGIAQMFDVIEQARMMVGTKAIATLSTGYLNALEYARTRLQGPDLVHAADKSAPRVPIIRHPDVRRMLWTMRALALGGRLLTLHAALDPGGEQPVGAGCARFSRYRRCDSSPHARTVA